MTREEVRTMQLLFDKQRETTDAMMNLVFDQLHSMAGQVEVLNQRLEVLSTKQVPDGPGNENPDDPMTDRT